MKILVINCGSSSIKFCLYEMPENSLLIRGQIEKIGLVNTIISFQKEKEGEKIAEIAVKTHQEGVQSILDLLMHKTNGCLSNLSELDAIGHRIAHGLDMFSQSVIINDEVFSNIENHSDLAPLHTPHNLKGIVAIRNILPDKHHVAVFDTAFHQTIPEHAYMYAIPYSYYEKYKIRRYGFHGSSHYFVSRRACEILEVDIHTQKIISCHLGNGSSITAIKNGKSIDTSMGFTPAEGLIMGTRPGDLDIGILPYLMKKENIDCDSMNTILNEKSGMLGISGVSPDMRDIEYAVTVDKNPRARLSLEMYYYRIKKYIGAYTAVLNGLDILVFTGGIGENCDEISMGLCSGLDYMGIELKSQTTNKNSVKERVISAEDSRVKVLVIPTNEEIVIAEETMQVITKLNNN